MDSNAPRKIVDPHVHIANAAKFCYPWYAPRNFPEGILWNEELYLKHFESLKEKYTLSGAVYVEACIESLNGNAQQIEEAKWALSLCQDKNSIIQACVPHISVSKGPEEVRTFLNVLRDESGALPKQLKGVRDNQMGKTVEQFTDPLFYDGVRELAAHGLHFEICIFPDLLPYVPKLVAAAPEACFVLDHCGFAGDL